MTWSICDEPETTHKENAAVPAYGWVQQLVCRL